MSYGVWKTRGKGWSAIEIDTPGNHATLYDLQDRNESRYRSLIYRLNRYNVQYDHMWDDYNQLAWEANQKKNYPNRKIVDYAPGHGEHNRWISFDDKEALINAITKNEDQPQLEEVLKYAKY